MNDKRTPGHIQIFGISLAPTGTIKTRHKLAATLTSARFECESQKTVIIALGNLTLLY